MLKKSASFVLASLRSLRGLAPTLPVPVFKQGQSPVGRDFGELSRAARQGWAGEKAGLFEHPAWRFLLLSRTYRPAEFWRAHKVFCNLLSG